MAIFEKTQRPPSMPPAPPGATAQGTVAAPAPVRPREQDTQSDAAPAPAKRGKKRGGSAMTSVTVKLSAAQLERIDTVVAAIQDLATVRRPDKNDVLVWMLTSVSVKDLRDKIAQWNALFE